MKKRYKTIMLLGLTAIMLILISTGCSKLKNADEKTTYLFEETTNKNKNSTFEKELTYPLDTKEKLTIGMVTSNAWSDRFDSFAELPIGKALSQLTGIEIEMIHVENNTAMSLLIASLDLPDIILFNFQSNYTGGEVKAIEDGVIYPLSTEFLARNAPDYLKVLNSNQDYMRGSTTPNQDIYGFTFIIGDEVLKTGYGLTVRDDWCRELGIPLPETTEEFYQMLLAFKDQKGVPSPLSITGGNLSDLLDRGVITTPFGLVTRDAYLKEKTVHIGYAQQEYKEVLVYLNKLYKEGLLDQNFSTLDTATVNSNILSGQSGVVSGALNGGLGNWLQINKEVKNYSLAGIPNLVAKRGDRALYGHYNTDVVGGTAIITTTSKNKELAARFLNFGYTDSGHMLYNFGILGESYHMVDDYPTYTDYIMNNKDGLSKQKAMGEYILAYGNGPFVQDSRYLSQYADLEEQQTAMKNWMNNDAKLYKIPRISISTSEISEYTILLNDIKTYRDKMTIKFIRGTESLDDFNIYLNTLEEMGINRIKEILQNAVDEYFSR